MQTESAIKCFQAIGQTHRLSMFRLLATAGETGQLAGELAHALDIAPSQVSFHLKELEHAGLVFATREGRFIRYRIEPTQVAALMEFLLSDCCRGRPELCTSQAQPPTETDARSMT